MSTASDDDVVPVPPPPHEGRDIDILLGHNDPGEDEKEEEGGKPRPGPRGGLARSVGKFVSSAGAFYEGREWRGYDDYVGARHFDPSFTARLAQEILASDRVQTLVRTLGAQHGTRYHGLTEQQVLGEARRLVGGLQGDISSKATVRLMVYLVNQLFIRLYHQGIHVDDAQLARLREVAVEAEARGVSLFFLPCHKSHIDYMVLNWSLYRMGLSLPFIAAGENLNLPVVGSLLKMCGAFFIRRSFNDDPLYNALFKEYISALLSRGYNLEAFIEGTRSRTGKLLNPKFGVVKVILEALLSGRINDVYMCPISIGYDRVLETASYVNELLGAEKKAESLGQLLSQARILGLKLGRIDLTFAKPFSLRAFVDAQMEGRRDFNPQHNPGDQMLLLKAVAYRVLMDINSVAVIMPTALVGTSLLTLRGRGVGKAELAQKVEWLRRAIAERGANVGKFSREEIPAIIDRTVKVLGGVVGERELLEPVFFAAKRFELSYYRNEVMHIFVEEAVLCCALYACQKEKGVSMPEKWVPKAVLLDTVRELSQLLKFEFIFPAGKVDANTEKTLRLLERNGVLTSDTSGVALSSREIEAGQEVFDFYCFLLWPFIETYWLCAVGLFTMSDTGMQVEKVFSNRLQHFANALYYQGELSYFESINKETLKNAQQVLQELGLIERKVVDKTSLIAINPEYQADSFLRLRDFVEHVGRFRREGKHRRDTQHAGQRTLRLAKLAVVASKL